MRIHPLDPEPLLELPFACVSPGGRGAELRHLPVLHALADGLPDGVDALLATSDLQGMELAPAGLPARHLGEVVAGAVADLCERGEARGVRLPDPAGVGVVLAGDLWSDPTLTRRGGFGDVRGVWWAFHARFRWVAGVLGNHDGVGSPAERARFTRTRNVYLLDGSACAPDGLAIGGLSGVVGDPARPGRHPVDRVTEALAAVLAGRPELLVLHEGPALPALRQRGHEAVTEALAKARGLTVICGHRATDAPLVDLPGGGQLRDDGVAFGRLQLLNVNERAVLLCRPAGRARP